MIIPDDINDDVIKIVQGNLWNSALHLEKKTKIQRWLCQLRGEKHPCKGCGTPDLLDTK